MPAGVVAGFIWYALGQGNRNNIVIANNLKIGLIVAGVIYTIFALISLAGLVGSLIRSRGLVRTFSVFLWLQLFISLAYLIAFSVALFDKPLQNRLITECVNQTNTTLGGKKARTAVDEKSSDATSLVKEAVGLIDSAVTKGILKRRTASRYVSRLATRVPPAA